MDWTNDSIDVHRNQLKEPYGVPHFDRPYIQELFFSHFDIPLIGRIRAFTALLVEGLFDIILQKTTSPMGKNPFCVETALGAAKLLDSQRMTRSLQARITKLQQKKTKATKREIREAQKEISRLQAEGFTSLTLSGTMTAFFRRWTQAIPNYVLNEYITQAHLRPWAQFIKLIHCTSRDFENPEFFRLACSFKKPTESKNSDLPQIPTTSPEMMKELFESGIIQEADYLKFTGVQNVIQEQTIIQEQVPQFQHLPFVVHADLGSLHCDVIVIKVGSSLMGYLGGKIEAIYGPTIIQYLKNKWGVTILNDAGKKEKTTKKKTGKKKVHRQKWNASDLTSNKPVYREGWKDQGLQPGWTGYVSAEELRKLPKASPTAPPLVVSIIGAKGVVAVSQESTAVNMENIFESIDRHMPASEKNTPKVVAIPAFCFGSGCASSDEDRIAILEAQINCMIDFERKFPFIVPVLITYSLTVQTLALKARNIICSQRGLSQPRIFLSDSEDAHLPALQAELSNGRVTLFLGAGVSLSSGLPSWSQLIERLADTANADIQFSQTSESMLSAAQSAKLFLGDRFPSAFREALGYHSDLPAPRPSLTHFFIAGLPLRDIVTTNYDLLLESAFKCLKLTAFTISEPKDVAHAPVSSFHTNILKIHGDLSNPDQAVFSASDYQNYFANKPAVSTLLRGLLLSRTFVFIGYSLRDPNLIVIIEEVGSILRDARRPCYAVVFEASDEEIISWKLRGVDLLRVNGNNPSEKTISLWSFLDLLQQKHYAPNSAWLAPDSKDFFSSNNSELIQNVNNLRENLKSMASLANTGQLNAEEIDFIFPFLLLGAQHGVAVHSYIWEKLADHYNSRTPEIEANKMFAIAATIQALAQSTGRSEQQFNDSLSQIEKFFRK